MSRQPLPSATDLARIRQTTLRCCETCPWLVKNHRRKHSAGWYTVANLRRLWTGLRTGDAPGMVCHATDPDSKFYGGKGHIKPGKKAECAGSLLLLLSNMNAISAGKPQPFRPALRKNVVADLLWRHLVGMLPAVEDRSADVGLPWSKPNVT
jgi:hypothetical protein